MEQWYKSFFDETYLRRNADSLPQPLPMTLVRQQQEINNGLRAIYEFIETMKQIKPENQQITAQVICSVLMNELNQQD